MASEMMSSDSATEHKTVAIEGSSSYSLGEAPVPERNAQMGLSSISIAKRGLQEFQESGISCGGLVSDGAGSSSGSKMLSASEGKIDDCDGVETLLEVKKKRLLDELEGGSIFQGTGPIEHPGGRALIMENFPDVGIKKFASGVNEYLRSSLKIELIDDTALIEPIASPMFVNVKEKSSKEDLGGKKAKRARGRGKGRNTGSEKAEGSVPVVRRIGDGTKRIYSREEIVALRFEGAVEQRKLWREIYHGLGPGVAKEYMTLANSNSAASQPPRRSRGPVILGEDSTEKMDVAMSNTNSSSPACGQSIGCEDESTNFEENGDEDSEDSDEYYASIQRPAFAVKGEPNFEAGEPEDGLEYLRRVRWEAARIPNVKVAKLDRSKLNKEQSVYMPVIPEIAKCPDHLRQSKQWEDEFLADFSKLRLSFSQAEASKVETLDKSQLEFILGGKNFSSHLAAPRNLQNQGPEDETAIAPDMETRSSEVLRTNAASGTPTVSLLLSMDSVSRVSNLRKRINAFEAATVLSRDDCLWIFALCATIDTPLHSDTCATLRGLLRKCASLRAQKMEVDDETVMLNILTTISGRFFGQSDI